MHCPATAFETQQHLIGRSGDGQNGGYFFPQLIDLTGLNVAIEIQHKDPRPSRVFTLFSFLFERLFCRLVLLFFLLFEFFFSSFVCGRLLND